MWLCWTTQNVCVTCIVILFFELREVLCRIFDWKRDIVAQNIGVFLSPSGMFYVHFYQGASIY
jgi:hypothetical protein